MAPRPPRAAPGEPPATQVLGRYRVVDDIGAGALASVHLARMDGPAGFHKWAAIKRLHPELAEYDDIVDMFLDDARIAAAIDHPNVAHIFDLGKDETGYWLAMEYLHGDPLRDVMACAEARRLRLPLGLAACICADAASGLHAAHELRGRGGQPLGLVHRAVTPGNLFVTYDGATKLVDFGFAKIADRLGARRAGVLKGKLAYMSPEQVRGEDIDRRTDIFALGVILWELTLGQPLFQMESDLETLEKVQACVVPYPSNIDRDYPFMLEKVVLKALARPRGDRFETALDFSTALLKFVALQGGPSRQEHVAAFVQQACAERIRQRDARLAWAAHVAAPTG